MMRPTDVATVTVPDGVVLEVAIGVADNSPSQERLTRIAAMLREAEQAMPVTATGSRRRPRQRRDHRTRRAA
jgi:hypothetical protein